MADSVSDGAEYETTWEIKSARSFIWHVASCAREVITNCQP
jgi:hypothetical protein